MSWRDKAHLIYSYHAIRFINLIFSHSARAKKTTRARVTWKLIHFISANWPHACLKINVFSIPFCHSLSLVLTTTELAGILTEIMGIEKICSFTFLFSCYRWIVYLNWDEAIHMRLSCDKQFPFCCQISRITLWSY